ncbi:hypothetical protein DFP73DRAFT_563399 [Morchella snyderi]|nr:hypothetical protein DFP73DRAFT_563399 [Morchella snyderi]
MSTSVMEKELTCSICTDLLYDPVTFLDCLHTNCGSCAKAWFQSLSNNAANAPVASSSAAPNVAKYTCPVCRAIVRATKHNPTLQSLIEDFVARNPDKGRTKEEKEAVRRIYTPGSGVLPGETGSRSAPSSSFVPPPAPPAALPPRRQASINPWGAPPAPRPQNHRNQPSSPAARESRRGPLPGSSPPPFLSMLFNSTEQSCAHCQKRIDFATRCCCSQCNILTCCACAREGHCCREPNTNHSLIVHRLQLNPRHIQTGWFCDVCETWCDNSGNEINAYFWACDICDNGSWMVCRPCVSKGNACTHELKLYSNQRPASRGPIRGAVVQNYWSIYTDLVRNSGTTNISLHARLSAFGYIRAMSLQIQCDNCLEVIPPGHSYLHCTGCLDGHWDMCVGCWYTMSEQIGGNEEASNFPCRYGHQMALLTQNGQHGTHKTIQDVPHDPPEYVSQSPSNDNGWPRMVGPKTATAIKGHWPEPQESNIDTVWRPDTPGVRPRDYGGLLVFPEKAEITDIWVAFTEGDGLDRVEYLWGWYSGIGGLFPRDCVEFTD